LIDEWQVAPVLWDAVRFEVDHRKKHEQFILTGSVVMHDEEDSKQIQHTGTGRIARLVMRPMSLWESGCKLAVCCAHTHVIKGRRHL